jgi:hypothetical protein
MKISVLSVLAVVLIMLSSIGIAAANDIKCAWEPCGTKVEQASFDATYELKPIKAMWAYQDSNSDGVFNNNDVLYIDTVIDDVLPALEGIQTEVEEGDVRLTNYHEIPANTKVQSTDADRKGTLKELPGGQALVGFVDINNDNNYDLGDPLYVDTDGDSKVSVNDVRLTERDVNNQHHEAYSRVASGDWDVGNDLLDVVTDLTNITTNSVLLLGFIDSDSSGDWTCPDKLYLQQLKGTIADNFATIGDLRLYIPPEAIINEKWPSCGTKVEQMDMDATYILDLDQNIRIRYGDVNSNGKYDFGETIYLDMMPDSLINNPYAVEAGDVRLSAYHNYKPNTKVFSTDIDKNNPLRDLPGGQAVVGYVDVNNNNKYDVDDPLYVDTDSSGRVSVGDLRLTPREAMGDTYEGYTLVANGDFDAILNEELQDTVVNGQITTPVWALLGYIDSDCSGDWTCPDKLYLQQITGDFVADQAVTIGDFRIYIPQEAIDHGWPICGTKVGQCDIDAVYTLTIDSQIRILFGDVNSNHIYDIGETVYVDMVNTGRNVVEAGDVRLTPYHDYAENTKVNSTSIDKNNELYPFPSDQAVIGYVDNNNNGAYDLYDPLYVDTDNNDRVSKGDVRLTEVTANGKTYGRYTVVESGDWDLLSNTVLKDPLTNGPIVTPFMMYVGYIDSDCSGDWTCVDMLYLQQLWVDDSPSNHVVTIGDLRLYIPPSEEIPVPTSYDKYDTNKNCKIDMGELAIAIGDWKTGTLGMGDLAVRINYWKAGSYC